MLGLNEMSALRQIVCWVVTDGKSGMENQCLGLAEALGLAPTVKRVKLRTPWQQFAPFLRHGLRYAFSSKGNPLSPPWPDLLIATGRASVPASLYVRQASAAAGKATFTVQLQNPIISPRFFDLVVVPQHDGLVGPNVLTTRGALHRVTPELLRKEAQKLRPRVVQLPKPHIALLLGGSNAVYQLTPGVMETLTAQLSNLTKSTGGSLLITPSRRTGEENLKLLKQGLQGAPAFIWDGQGENPYYGMLGLADYILVTCDSVNMVSEACTTGKPVYVVDLPGGSEKFRRFHAALRGTGNGLTRVFQGRLDEPWKYQLLDDVNMVAGRIKELMARR